MPTGATWIKDAVSSFQPDDNQLTTAKGTVISYDVLIVCPGLQVDWDKIEGLRDTLGKNNVSCNYSFQHAPYTWEMIKNFKGGKAVLPTGFTIKWWCPHTKSCIWLLTTGPRWAFRMKFTIFLVRVQFFAVKEYAETLNKVVKKRHIHTHFGVNVVSIDGDAKKSL